MDVPGCPAYCSLPVSVVLSYKSNLNQLTPWIEVLPEDLRGPQLVNEFPAFDGTIRFITALTRACHRSLSKSLPHTLNVFMTLHILCTCPTTGNNFLSVWHPSYENWIALHTLTSDHVYSRPTLFIMNKEKNDMITVSLHDCMTTNTIHTCPLHRETKGCMKQLYMNMVLPYFFKLQCTFLMKTCEILSKMQFSFQEHYCFIVNTASYFSGKDSGAKYHCTPPETGTGLMELTPKSIFTENIAQKVDRMKYN